MEGFKSSALGRVTVYSIQGCPHCVQAKATLRSLGVPVCEVDVGLHSELRVKLKELTGRSTVPQIFFNNIHVGGNDDLQKLATEELQRLVTLVKEEPLSANAPPLPESNPFEAPDEEIDGQLRGERDEFADLVEDLKHAGVIGSQRRGLTLYKNSFSGIQLVDWLQTKKGMDRAEACNTGQTLLQKKFMVSVGGIGQEDGCFGEGKETMDTLYRLLEDDLHSPLNGGQTAAYTPKQAAELSLLLRELILKLFSEHLSADGKSVDYKGMSVDPAFERYCELAIQLQRVELLSLSREEKLAFFINIYNALVIHGYLRLGAPTNMWQRYKGGEETVKKVVLTDPIHPFIRESLAVVKHYFPQYALQDQNILGRKESEEKVLALVPEDVKKELQEIFQEERNPERRWRHIEVQAKKKQTAKKRQYFEKEIMLQYCYPRLDVNVSKGVNHLLKSPFSVHPKTGRISVPIDLTDMDKFDPFAVPTISLICEELDRPKADEDEAKSEDTKGKENEQDSTEKRKIRDYKRTSLAKYVKYFDQFLAGMADSWKGKLLRQSDLQKEF